MAKREGEEEEEERGGGGLGMVNYRYSENHRVSKIWRMPSSFKSLLASYEGAARYLNIVARWLGMLSPPQTM
jgi:hypothetical protein